MRRGNERRGKRGKENNLEGAFRFSLTIIMDLSYVGHFVNHWLFKVK